jgi:hypothetical protein
MHESGARWRSVRRSAGQAPSGSPRVGRLDRCGHLRGPISSEDPATELLLYSVITAAHSTLSGTRPPLPPWTKRFGRRRWQRATASLRDQRECRRDSSLLLCVESQALMARDRLPVVPHDYNVKARPLHTEVAPTRPSTPPPMIASKAGNTHLGNRPRCTSERRSVTASASVAQRQRRQASRPRARSS